MRGILYLLRIQDAAHTGDGLKIFGVRQAKFLPSGWVHWQELSPSSSLLWDAKRLEKQGKWNGNSFRTMYRPRYMKELKQREGAKKEFNAITESLEQGVDVYYACYCTFEHCCHRSLVGEITRVKGYQVVSFTPSNKGETK